ncbi:hypothetical protein BO83DRAFT_390036 [Aspergillus eucalypticola CBS 122712]|uniref:Uncharacterized protein n=1 Tax=Aspergillus eucalypticola (strain CBS 122712 / IBT 29274) TaxID=1448314 RepID=A0A317V954_ASPEC|nr:uncharacterized protein BO83DRAFT_390036 [Aspergillus eucalypticola CBS 122712]PWY69919.1 hypothetical protein BO83DRAFT_390036 [Aspergillus eucalypticola CBS 122712]
MTKNMQASHTISGDDERNYFTSGKEIPPSTLSGLNGDDPVAPCGERTTNVDLPDVSRLKPSESELSGLYTPIAVFWDCLMKEDGLCEVPKSRYNVDSFYHPTRERSTQTKYGYFLQEDPAYFDAQLFSVRNHESTRMDPQQRLLLELVWECLESAGETDWEEIHRLSTDIMLWAQAIMSWQIVFLQIRLPGSQHNAIPSSIEHLLVRSVGEYMDVNVEVKQETGNFLAGNATAMFEDNVVLSMRRGMHFSHGSEGNTSPIPLVVQVQWRPNIDFQPPQVLLPHFEMSKSLVDILHKTNGIAGMYILQTVEKIKHIQPQASHLSKWKDWLLTKEANIYNDAQILGSYRDSHCAGPTQQQQSDGAMLRLGSERSVGGTGAATAAALRTLYNLGVPMYSNYMLTDIAPNSLEEARSRFESYKNMQHVTLDIRRDPLEQGFAESAFDLIIASNGALPSWWISEDRRRDGHYMILEGRNQELHDAGFTGTDIIRDDFDAPYRSSATIITRLIAGSTIKPSISLLITDRQSPGNWANTVHSRLTDLGYMVEWTTLADPPTNKKCITVLLDQEVPFLFELTDSDFHALRDYSAQINQCVTLWVTKSTQVTSEDPNFGLGQGFVRSVRQELMIGIYMLEVESFEQNAASALGKIVQKSLTVQGCGRFCAPQRVYRWLIANSSYDILAALGYVGSTSELGLEGSGTVRRAGKHVTDLVAGDEVSVLLSGLSMKYAAGMALAYLTAIYSLDYVGQVQKDQTVRIHSACGGVRLAAIQICKIRGAKVSKARSITPRLS